jgi:hypothetical protein
MYVDNRPEAPGIISKGVVIRPAVHNPLISGEMCPPRVKGEEGKPLRQIAILNVAAPHVSIVKGRL